MIRKMILKIKKIAETFQEHRLNASAAHAAFFIILSFIPCIILLFSLLQFISIERLDVIGGIQVLIPPEIQPLFSRIVKDAYNNKISIVSFSALAMVWSAGRGMMALTQGLQWIYGIRETRHYFQVRIRAAFYTVVLLLSIIAFLLVWVFGNGLLNLISLRYPIAEYVIHVIVDVKNIVLLLFATVIFAFIYRFMPGNRMEIESHLPGAVISALGWFGFSYVFSIYVNDSSKLSSMYGSLTAVIIFMLWMYFGMYITLIGAEFNQLLSQKREKT